MTPTTQPAEHTKEPVKHTAEPWELHGATHIWSPIAKSNVASASEPRGHAHVGYEPPKFDGGGLYEAAANAARIVACVNALAGIPAPESAIEQAREALTEIADIPAVAFSTDRLTHATRTIEKMQELARKALSNLTPATDKQG